MQCTNCKKENPDNALFCKNCGAKMSNFKTCSNGHNYSADLNACPFCPSQQSFSSQKTQMISDVSDRTRVDISQPVLSKTNSSVNNSDRTMIYSPPQENKQELPLQASSLRKLIGWLVTYDLNPEGTDFRIVVGRSKIGNNQSNDFVLNATGVSDDHAVILYRDNKLWIQDQLSTNGTFVNDELIEEKTKLSNGDIIKMGNVKLKVVIVNPEEMK